MTVNWFKTAKGFYSQWTANHGVGAEFQPVLDAYDRLKQIPTFPKELRDISRMTPDQVKAVVQKYRWLRSDKELGVKGRVRELPPYTWERPPADFDPAEVTFRVDADSVKALFRNEEIGSVYHTRWFANSDVGWTIVNFGVNPYYAARGIGTKLLQLLIADAKKNKVKLLLLNASPKAVPLYERLGFRVSRNDARYPQMTLSLEQESPASR